MEEQNISEKADQNMKCGNRRRIIESFLKKKKKCLWPTVTAEHQNVKKNQMFYLVGSIGLLLESDTMFTEGETLQISAWPGKFKTM